MSRAALAAGPRPPQAGAEQPGADQVVVQHGAPGALEGRPVGLQGAGRPQPARAQQVRRHRDVQPLRPLVEAPGQAGPAAERHLIGRTARPGLQPQGLQLVAAGEELSGPLVELGDDAGGMRVDEDIQQQRPLGAARRAAARQQHDGGEAAKERRAGPAPGHLSSTRTVAVIGPASESAARRSRMPGLSGAWWSSRQMRSECGRT